MQLRNVTLWTHASAKRRALDTFGGFKEEGGGRKRVPERRRGRGGGGGGGGLGKWGGRERERKETGGGGAGEREREPEILMRERDERYMRRFSRQKRPIHVAKETYSCGKRDLKEMRDT
jgi:hypothetical protein